MGEKSFLGKFLFLLVIIILIVLMCFFITNKKTVESDIKNIESISSININTYDEDSYIYKLEDNKIFVSQFFYNNYYLSNNTDVEFNIYPLLDDVKYYLKTMANTQKDINNIKISYDPITQKEFIYLLNNYSLLKVYIWLDNNSNCKNIVLYSSNDIPLELIQE